jgi:hypothetical protein
MYWLLGTGEQTEVAILDWVSANLGEPEQSNLLRMQKKKEVRQGSLFFFLFSFWLGIESRVLCMSLSLPPPSPIVGFFTWVLHAGISGISLE